VFLFAGVVRSQMMLELRAEIVNIPQILISSQKASPGEIRRRKGGRDEYWIWIPRYDNDFDFLGV